VLYTSQFLKHKGVRTIVIDPRYSDTAMLLADQWVPIRPGTDAALVSAMVHVMISEGLQDQAFLDKYVQGFDEEHMPEGVPAGNSYRSYIMGLGPDGIEKTPQWAAEITGIPAETIVKLAREIATTKPCAINQGWGPQRHMNGENQARAIYALAAVTGNVGINGGGTGGRDGHNWLKYKGFPSPKNQVKASIPMFLWTDAIKRGPEMTAAKDGIRGVEQLSNHIRFLLNVQGNVLGSQHGDLNETEKILKDESLCEFICVVDNMMTASARLADLVLPDTLNQERWDMGHSEYCGETAYYMFNEKAIEPPFDVKDCYDVCVEIAKRFGKEQEFSEGRSREEWAKWLAAESQKTVPGLPSWDEMRKQGIYRYNETAGTYMVPLRKFREDPEANPLTTPSGKIEIFSSKLWEMSKTWTFDNPQKGDKITALPEYMEVEEGPEAAKGGEFPLQCIGHHYKGRVHSTFANLEWLLDAHPQKLFMNPVDAEARRIKEGDEIEIFNNRGRVRTVAHITPRIMPGVVSLPQGAWRKMDGQVDVGGAVNTLTSMHPTAYAKGNGQHTNLVQVEKTNAR